MEAFASIVLLVTTMFVYPGFTAVTEKLDEIIERLPPPRQPRAHSRKPRRTLPSSKRCPAHCSTVARRRQPWIVGFHLDEADPGLRARRPELERH
jgi:hypothetical protein